MKIANNQNFLFLNKKYLKNISPNHSKNWYLHCIILRIARNFVETRENIKILTHPFYHINLDWFSWEWGTIFFFFEIKMANFKKLRFSKSPILKKFSRKFHRLVLGLVGLIEAKGIDVAFFFVLHSNLLC